MRARRPLRTKGRTARRGEGPPSIRGSASSLENATFDRAGEVPARIRTVIRRCRCRAHVLLALAMRGATAKAIQELAGHKDLTTTQMYMHLSPAALEDAIRLLDGDGYGANRGEIVEAAGTENPNH